MLLRRATLADLPQVVAMERACYADPWPASAFASLPANEQAFFTVAIDSVRGGILGYVVAWYVLDEGELANLAVIPAARGRGVGGLLLDDMLADARERGVSDIYLEVRASNSIAQRLYASRRFQEVGRRPRYYKSPVEDALILRHALMR